MKNFLLTAVLLTTALSGFADSRKDKDRPNILVILCDDLGYNDVGFNGSKDIITPELDKLAANGAVFSSAYVAHPFCGPSRAGFITGRYPQIIGTPYNLPFSMGDKRGHSHHGVPVSETYISNVMQGAGYFTSAIGKWHLGFDEQFQPNNRGFDEFFGFLGGGHRYFPEQFQSFYKKQIAAGASSVHEYFTPLLHNKNQVTEKEYITDAFTREAVRMINDSQKKKKPFFMYLAYNAPHTPLEAKEEDIKVFSHIKDKDRRTYAAMVYAVDRGVGKIVEALKKNGQFDNTLIVFFSDNGGSTDFGSSNFPLKGEKGDTWEGGFRVPMFFHWPNKISPKTYKYPVSALDLYPTFTYLGNAKLPQNKVLDGKNIIENVISNTEAHPNDPIYSVRYRTGFCDVAARLGDWKILRMGNEPWELFNISNDIGEKRNLSGKHPEKLKELVERTREWTKSHIKPLWVYSEKDAELWRAGRMPNYDETFEVDKLQEPASEL